MNLSLEDFWQFSLITYADKQNELLNWQDEHGANVNLALFCLYLAHHQVKLTTAQITKLHQEVRLFSQQTTQKVRILRKEFKTLNSDIQHYNEIKQHLLDAELLLEKQEQSVLFECFQKLPAVDKHSHSHNWQDYQTFLINAQ